MTGCTGQGAPSVPTPSAPVPSTPSAPAVTTTPVPTPSPSSTPETAAEQRYVAAVRQLSTTLAPVDPAILIALGHDVCRSFAAGRTAQQVSDSFARLKGVSGLSGAEAAVIIGAAVPTLCPRFRDRLS